MPRWSAPVSEPHNIKVFISYSHDSAQHRDRVLRLSDRLRAEGVDCEIDQYETSPLGGWPRWTRNKIKEADYVLIVCTQAYERRYEATEKNGVGAGAKWEGTIVTQQLYEAEGTSHKFIPVTFSAEDIQYIPMELRGASYNLLDSESGYESLYRRLTSQPEVIKQHLGKRIALPPRKRQDTSLNSIEESRQETQSHPSEAPIIPEETLATPAVENEASPAGIPRVLELSPDPSRIREVFTRHRRWVVASLAAVLVMFGAFTLLRPRQHVAVMPFPVVSSDRDIEHLSGLTTDFFERSLAKVPGLTLKGHTSVFYYKDKRVGLRQIGMDLGVTALLTGHISLRENRLSVAVAVVDAQTEKQLWQRSYEDELTNLPLLQSKIAYDVSNYFGPWWWPDAYRLKAARSNTLSYEALELYSQGSQFWRNRNQDGNLSRAIKKFEEAKNKDDRYAQAYIGLADCYALREDFEGLRASVTIPQAEEYADRALALDDSLAEAHASKGFVLFNKWDWDGAEKEFNQAIDLNRDYPTTYQWYSILLRTRGAAHFDKAFAMIKMAEELDPLSDVIISNVGVLYLSKGDADNAAAQFEKWLKLYPDSQSAQRWLAIAYLKQGRKPEALAALQKGTQGDISSGALSFQGYIYAVVGMIVEAVEIAGRLEMLYQKRGAIALDVATVYAGLGDNDRAIQWLRTAKDDRSGNLQFMRMTMFDGLRGDSRYNELLRQIDLDP